MIVCGPGNNGADGLVAARMLDEDYKIKVFLLEEPKSAIAKLQYERVKALHVKEVKSVCKADCIVDCLFGSGLSRELDNKTVKLLEELNRQKALKIACDIPTGINEEGKILQNAFKADVTVSMGALKIALLSDRAKEFTGKIKVANLGLNSKLYKSKTDVYLLEKKI